VKTTSLSCTGTPVNYSVSTTRSIVSYTWSVQPTKDLIDHSDFNAPTISLNFSTTTNHTLYLKFTDDTGLPGAAATSIVLYQTPKASFNASFNGPGLPTDLILTNYSSNFSSNFWSFNDTAGDSALNTSRTYTAAGNYSVTLLTFSEKGCKDSSTYDFKLSDFSSLVLPNIFTPNGDGANDIYRPISQGLSSISVKICNRFGVLVTSWTTVNGFWNGYTISGEECSEGVYYVVVEAKGFDGKDYKLNSSIQLAR
jgi:gliding motility-associated-like protein